ncbi:MAG TPA: ABC transporter permease [Candidatus Dormibacteraeota bacterium]|jgi:ABC-2 type transport system permease protein|nr:ABC transporter permease [Candidatus Dormibacteraeota bacterium]
MLNLALGGEARALLGFIERQKNLVRRYWAWEFVWLLYNVVNVLSVGFLGDGLGRIDSHVSLAVLHRTQLYLLVGSLLWGYLGMVFVEIAYAIDTERWEGTIEYTFMAPMRRITHLSGICLFSIVYGFLRSLLVFLIAIFMFHLDLASANPLSAAVVMLASIIPLVGMGVIASVLPLVSPEKGQQMTMVLEGAILLVSGVYYPISVLPLPLQVLGRIMPLTYTLDGTRAAIVYGAPLGRVLPDVAVLIVMGVLLVPIGLWIFGRAEHRAKRLGLLKRSG